MSLRSLTFRQDINALRALSVIAVLGYHLRIPGFASGFVGVDVFLVITGYLMVGKALTDLVSGRFSLWGFGKMRLRRIYPALAVVTVASVIVGWFVTLPHEYLKHLRQACYALAFLSNFAFDNDNGYFAMAAQTKPLLHTWSLAVEWQFYIWMPIAVWFIWRSTRSEQSKLAEVNAAFVIVAAISLAWCLWQYRTDAMGSAFFSLRARAWEPLAGGMISIAEMRNFRWRIPPSILSAIGWMIVVSCVAASLPEAQWPGPLTVFPIIGACAIIIGRPGIVAERFLSLQGIQRIGDWSYSIYLWHWPIWVFGTTWLSFHGYHVGKTMKTLMVIASFTFGAASYYFVEQPVRTHKSIWTEKLIVTSTAAVIFLLLGFTATAFWYQGFPSRLTPYLIAAEDARREDTPRDECFRNSNSVKKATETYCSFGSDEDGGHTAILWGDSFANQYLEPISSAARKSGIHGLIATQSACRAFIDNDQHTADQPHCREFNRSTADFVLSHSEPSIVILGSNWSDSAEVSNLVDTLLKARKIVILIMPLLNVGFDVPQRWMERQVRAGHAINEWSVRATNDLLHSSLRGAFKKILDRHPQVIEADPQPVICKSDECFLVRHDQANFRDSVHISNVNAEQYEAIFNVAFGEALNATKSE